MAVAFLGSNGLAAHRLPCVLEGEGARHFQAAQPQSGRARAQGSYWARGVGAGGPAPPGIPAVGGVAPHTPVPAGTRPSVGLSKAIPARASGGDQSNLASI